MHNSQIEQKWHKRWEESKVFEANIKSDKKKFYALEMFPYPSGKIHMGHIRNYTIGDVIARLKIAQGYNVLHPIGWDAFGLPAENAAIKNKAHPARWTEQNIATMRNQLKKIGFSYDWSREISTCQPDYYMHSQSLFIDLLNADLAYQKEAMVNWDPVDNTVLANEQVVDGRGWRSGAIVEKKLLKQWFLKITDFAEDLLQDIDKLKGWPEKVRSMQRNWIGKSEGAKVTFKVHEDEIEIFTTRPETLFGASFIGISYDHPFVKKIKKTPGLESFIKECEQFGTAEENIEKAEKKGFNTSFFAEHPIDSNIKVPIFIANFVLSEYGTGAIFGCPAHDERDHEFATKYDLKINQVVSPENGGDIDIIKSPFLEDGKIINSSFLNGLNVKDAKEQAIKWLEENNSGKREINYRLRDWGISRQRYWGCPIPIIHCDHCGTISVKKEDLPVKLPEDVSFDNPGNPLKSHPTWKHVKCHKCGRDALRETDTFDTFVESSWYFLRFTTPKFSEPINHKETNYWMSVDQYVGGAEHTVLHLLYSRFFTKALKKIGYLEHDEPFLNLLNQGMICHETYKDKNGEWLYPNEVKKSGNKAYHLETGAEVQIGRIEKMSKSKYNVIEPEAILEKYGADTTRLFLLSDSPPDRDLEWTDQGVEGAHRYLVKLEKMAEELSQVTDGDKQDDSKAEKLILKTIYDVTEYLEEFAFNKAIAKVRELTNFISSAEISNKMKHRSLSTAVQLLNPLIPHITEEIWEKLGHKEMLINTNWPKIDKKLIEEEEVTIPVQINGKLRSTLKIKKGLAKEEVEKAALGINQINSLLSEKTVKKIIYVPNKILNIVCV